VLAEATLAGSVGNLPTFIRAGKVIAEQFQHFVVTVPTENLLTNTKVLGKVGIVGR